LAYKDNSPGEIGERRTPPKGPKALLKSRGNRLIGRFLRKKRAKKAKENAKEKALETL
jgi:hypothetical protein